MKKRNILNLLAAIALSVAAFGSQTTLTGTIKDSQGNGIQGVLFMSLPVPAQDQTTSVQVSPVPVAFRLVNGVITGGAQLYDVANLQPAGLYYTARAYDNSGNLAFNGNYIVTGATFNMGTAVPTSVTTSNISYSGAFFTSLANTVTGNNTFSGTNTHSGTETFTKISPGPFVFADSYTSVQAAITTGLGGTAGTVYLTCGSSYVGPTTLPNGITIKATCPGGGISPFPNFNTAVFNTTLTYSSNLTLGGTSGLTGITIDGVTLAFSGSSTLTLSSVASSTFNMAVTCATGTPCMTITSTVAGGSTLWNRFQFLQVISNAGATTATVLQIGSPANTFSTENVFTNTILVASGTAVHALFALVGNCDSNQFLKIAGYFTNAGAVNPANGVIFNDSGTPAVDSDADWESIEMLDFTNSGTLTGTGIQVNASTGNHFRAVTGLSQFSTRIAYTGIVNLEVEDVGGYIFSFGITIAASGFNLYPTSGNMANGTRLASGNPSGAVQITMPTQSSILAMVNQPQTWSGTQSSMTISASNILGSAVSESNLLISPTAPTIAAAGCGGAAASIVNPNGSAAFKINVGTTPGSACTVTMPTAIDGWNCSAVDITTANTSVFLQKQTGAESTTSVTITNYNTAGAATAFVASDILKVTCGAD